MKNILIIGSSGFIGKNLLRELIPVGCNIIVLEDNLLQRGEQILAQNVIVEYGRLSDTEVIARVLENYKVDTVIHLASSMIPSSGLGAYMDEIDSIIKPTIKLLSILSEKSIKLIYFSSGGTIYGVHSEGFFDENSGRYPISFYGQSKLLLEQAIEFEHRKNNLKYLILRPSNPYGQGQKLYAKQGLIATIIGHILNKNQIEVWGDGSAVRDYIHIDDLIKAVIALMNNFDGSGTFNIGSGIGWSINSVLDIFRLKLGIQLDVRYINGRSSDVPSIILNVERLRRFWKDDFVSLEEGISSFYLAELKIKENSNG